MAREPIRFIVEPGCALVQGHYQGYRQDKASPNMAHEVIRFRARAYACSRLLPRLLPWHTHLKNMLLLLLKFPSEDGGTEAVQQLVNEDAHDVQTGVDVAVPNHAVTFAVVTAPHGMYRSAFLIKHRLQPLVT